MKYKYLELLIAAILLPIISITAQDMGFEEYNPKSTLVVPVNEVKRAKFPFIDVHSHQRNMSATALNYLVKDMDELNEGIMVNLSGGSGKRINTMLQSIKENYPNRFAVFANVDFDGVGSDGWAQKQVLNWKLILKMVQKA